MEKMRELLANGDSEIPEYFEGEYGTLRAIWGRILLARLKPPSGSTISRRRWNTWNPELARQEVKERRMIMSANNMMEKTDRSDCGRCAGESGSNEQCT